MTRTFSIPGTRHGFRQVEPPLVERPPRDRPVERRPALLQRPQVVHRRDPAAGDHRDRHRPRQRRRRRHVRPRHRAVALDVGIDRSPRRRRPRTAAPGRLGRHVAVVSAQPSTATMPFRASIPTATRPGCARAASRTSSGSRSAAVPRITRAHALLQPGLDRRPVADAAAELHRHRRPRARIASTAAPLTGRPAKAPLRSTRCSHRQPGRHERPRLRRRIVAEHRRRAPSRRAAAARTGRP